MYTAENKSYPAQSDRAVEHIDCKGVKTCHKECPGYATKRSNGEARSLGSVDYPIIAIDQKSILARSGSTW